MAYAVFLPGSAINPVTIRTPTSGQTKQGRCDTHCAILVASQPTTSLLALQTTRPVRFILEPQIRGGRVVKFHRNSVIPPLLFPIHPSVARDLVVSRSSLLGPGRGHNHQGYWNRGQQSAHQLIRTWTDFHLTPRNVRSPELVLMLIGRRSL